MASLVILIRSAPYGSLDAAEGVRHLAGRQALGFQETVGAFCDDGVFALVTGQEPAAGFTSLEGALRTLADEGMALLAERSSLAQRGLRDSDLIGGVRPLDSAEGLLGEADVVLVF
ncbi:MAG TPA: DsrE family protein [Solirubrobacterales bacterium]|nr:DsrE family protein [Solirubrobacterales bacterium]